MKIQEAEKKQNSYPIVDQKEYQTEKRGVRYLLWLLIAVVLVSVISFITTAYSNNAGLNVLLDSVNNSGTVYFDYGKFSLKEEAYPVMNRIADEMKNSSEVKLYITGYTDDRGSEQFNNSLSLDRANAVKDYLISKGVNEENLIIKAMGKNDPLNDNANDIERALNRRVVFSFYDTDENTGKYAIDKFPGSRFYAEATLKNEYVNSSFKVISRDEITAELSIRDSAGQPVDSVKAEDITALLKWEQNCVYPHYGLQRQHVRDGNP